MNVLFEDNHIIAINKKPSEIVQGDNTGDKPLVDFVKDFLKKKYAKPGNVYLGVTHRLDRPTSGIVLFAKTSKVLPRLNKMFQEGKISKKYLAVLLKQPPKEEDTLIHYLVRNHKKNKSTAHDKMKPESKKAILSYRLIEKSGKFYLTEITLHTGRHHQIRAQLAKVGCAIQGDLKYGAGTPNTNASIHLHAYKLSFMHPVRKEPIEIIAPTPDDAIWNRFSV